MLKLRCWIGIALFLNNIYKKYWHEMWSERKIAYEKQFVWYQSVKHSTWAERLEEEEKKAAKPQGNFSLSYLFLQKHIQQGNIFYIYAPFSWKAISSSIRNELKRINFGFVELKYFSMSHNELYMLRNKTIFWCGWGVKKLRKEENYTSKRRKRKKKEWEIFLVFFVKFITKFIGYGERLLIAAIKQMLF